MLRRAYLPTAIVVFGLAACLALAALTAVSTAAYVLAVVLIVLAITRLVFPWRAWVGGRSAGVDAAALLVMAAALLYLAPYGDAAQLVN